MLGSQARIPPGAAMLLAKGSEWAWGVGYGTG